MRSATGARGKGTKAPRPGWVPTLECKAESKSQGAAAGGGEECESAGREAGVHPEVLAWCRAGEAPRCPRPGSQREVPFLSSQSPRSIHMRTRAHPAPDCSQVPRVSPPARDCARPDTARHGRTRPYTATHSHTEPHTATQNNTWPHRTIHGHTEPHTATYRHTQTHTARAKPVSAFWAWDHNPEGWGGEGSGLPDSETPLAPSSLGAPQRNPQQVRGAGLPGSSQYPEEITQEREKAPGKPARPLQGGPAQGDTGQGSGLAAGLPDGSGQMLLVDSAKVTLSSAEPP